MNDQLARYIKQEQELADVVRAWFTAHPTARPEFICPVPPEDIVFGLYDAIDVYGLIIPNDDARSLLAAVKKAQPDIIMQPTVGMFVRAVDAAQRVKA